MMNNLQEYLEKNMDYGVIDFRLRANPADGAVHIYIRPIDKDGETLDFYVSGNALIDKTLADKVSDNPGEAIEALRSVFRSANVRDDVPGTAGTSGARSEATSTQSDSGGGLRRSLG